MTVASCVVSLFSDSRQLAVSSGLLPNTCGLTMLGTQTPKTCLHVGFLQEALPPECLWPWPVAAISELVNVTTMTIATLDCKRHEGKPLHLSGVTL